MEEITFKHSIGNKNYVVVVKSAKKAKETVEEKLKKLVTHEVIALAKSAET